MNCEEILTLLDAYFDNELDLAKTVAIEEHLHHWSRKSHQITFGRLSVRIL